MKKTILKFLSIAVLTTMVIYGCKKSDSTPPVVTLKGNASETVSLQGTYTDAGATANDDVDGTVTVTDDHSSTNPNVNLVGTYTITYSATDKAGNAGKATRTVIVKNDADYLAGTYVCSEDGFATNWTQTVTADNSHNNRIIFQYFGDYVTHPLSPQIYAQVIGSNVELSTSQNAVGGASGCTHTLTPNGTTGTVPIALVSGKYNFSIKFTDQEITGGTSCPGTIPVPTEDVCHQQ